MKDPLLQGLEDSILRICERNPQGLADSEIVKNLDQDVKPANRLSVYNSLLGKGRLKLAERFTQVNGVKKKIVLYQWISSKDAQKFKGLDPSSRMVYDVIQKAQHLGASKRDIRIRTNITNSSELKQIVDRLISKGLVKEVKSVQGSNKKVYIISELEPSTVHTGGPWYNDEQEFDNEFIEAMYAQVLAFIRTLPYVNVEQVTKYVAEIKLSNETLSQNDIRKLLEIMLYDTNIEQCDGAKDGAEYFRQVAATPGIDHLKNIPCGSCPLLKDCSPTGVISPQNCVYMTEWLDEVSDW